MCISSDSRATNCVLFIVLKNWNPIFNPNWKKGHTLLTNIFAYILIVCTDVSRIADSDFF